MLRAILFDFNGVLVDDEPLHLELVRRLLEEEEVTVSPAFYGRRMLGIPDRECFDVALRAAGDGAPGERVERLVERKAALYRSIVERQGFPQFPGVARLVADADDRGLMLGVVTGALRSEVDAALSQMGILERFKVIVSAEDITRGKPDPQGYIRAVATFNTVPPLPSRMLHPHEVLAVEDTPQGLWAAHAAGLQRLGVAHTVHRDHLQLAESVVDGLGGLDADRLIEMFGGVG